MSTTHEQPTSQHATPEPAESTHLVLVLDRSGSMSSVKDDVIGGWNQFLRAQQAQPGKATLTQIQFDSQDPFEVVHHFKALQEVSPLDDQTFVPRGSTPLLDALGQAINTTALDLAASTPGNRPEKVLFVCITDGQENASRKYNKAEVTKLIERMQGGGWQFVFLSSDLGAVHEATNMGFDQDSVIRFSKSAHGVKKTMDIMTEKFSAYRRGGVNANVTFNKEEREEAMKDK